MTFEEIRFLEQIQQFVKSKPARLGNVIAAATTGIEKYAEEINIRSMDMETVASMALHARLFNGNEKHIADLLSKHKERSALSWEHVIDNLEKKAKKREQ